MRGIHNHIRLALPLKLNIDIVVGWQFEVPTEHDMNIVECALLDQGSQPAWPPSSNPAHQRIVDGRAAFAGADTVTTTAETGC